MLVLTYRPSSIGVAPIVSPYVLPAPTRPIRTSLFTNNAMVFYKGGSMGSTTVGGITNSRRKALRT